MRKKSVLTFPQYEQREYSLTKFKDKTATAENICVLDDSLETWAYYQDTGIYRPDNAYIQKIIVIDGKIYAYCDDSGLYRRNSTSWEKIFNCLKEPAIEKTQIDGKDYLVFAIADTCRLMNSAGVVSQSNIPYGKVLKNYKGMLFIANGNQLKFSALLDKDNFNMSEYAGGMLETNVNDGNIIELVPEQDALVIFCQKAIYRLTAVGERQDYKLIREDFQINVLQGTIKKFGDGIYFSNGDSLFKYTKGNISQAKTSQGLSKYSFLSGVGVVDNAIYFCIREKNKNSQKILVLDAEGKRQTILPLYMPLLSDDGYFFEINQIKKVVVDGGVRRAFKWESKVLDLGTSLKKSLLRVSVDTTEPIKVSVIGNYSTKILEFNAGQSQQKINLPGYAYKIMVSGLGSNVSVNSIKLIYRVKEEI